MPEYDGVKVTHQVNAMLGERDAEIERLTEALANAADGPVLAEIGEIGYRPLNSRRGEIYKLPIPAHSSLIMRHGEESDDYFQISSDLHTIGHFNRRTRNVLHIHSSNGNVAVEPHSSNVVRIIGSID